MPEIIDLTADSSPILVSVEISSGDELPPPSTQQGASKEKKRNRSKKKKKSKGPVTGSVNTSTQNSRDHTPKGGSDQRNKQSLDRRSPLSLPELSATGAEESQLFYFDTTKGSIVPDTGIESALQPGDVLSEPPSQDVSRLVLPSHVSVLASSTESVGPIEVILPPTVECDDDYIDFLEYEDRKAPGLVRYFDNETDEAGQTKPSIFKCKHCGAEGDHKSYECPVLICLTCGARDDHSTRSCPISKTCFTCGMKGHINKTCPNRYSARTSDLGDDCDRCGSQNHRINECPTLWRIYQYVTDEERNLIKKSREEKKQLSIGRGGEGFIGTDEWCYNCANTGHLGDDCDELPRPSGVPVEPSAFSAYNLMTGPFYDPATEPVHIGRGPRALQSTKDLPGLPDDLGMNIPVDVGKRARHKDKERLEKRFREQEDDDPGDWFHDSWNAKNREMKEPPRLRGKTMKFGTSLKDGGRQFLPPASPPDRPRSLLARLGGGADQRDYSKDNTQIRRESLSIRGAADRHDNGWRSRGRARHQERQWGDRDTDKRSNRDYHRPRYSGGYNR